MENILELITENKVGYKFQCDDRKRRQVDIIKSVPTDTYFALSDISNLNKLLTICNKHHLNYNLILEEWNEATQEITKEIYIIGNNELNN